MKAYKGFNKYMTCRGFQFKEGETYQEEKAKLCESGFHACEDPLDCFGYYAPADSVYHEVELEDVSDERRDDTKICGKTIKIGAELSVRDLINAKFEFNKKQCTEDINGGYNPALACGDWSALSGGYRSALSGGYGSALNGGNRSALNGGDWSALSGGDGSALSGGYGSALNGGNGSVLRGGIGAKFKGGLWSIFGAEYSDEKENLRLAVAVVDGDKIKPDVWYTLKDGEFVEVEIEEEE